MSLHDLYKSILKEKSNEVFARYKEQIMLAAPDAREKAIKHYLGLLYKEKQDMFSQKTDPKERYHYIENFALQFYAPLQGLYNSFEKEFSLAKENILTHFKREHYLNKIKIFLKQDDKEIVKKMAEYYAYDKVIATIESWANKKDLAFLNSKLGSAELNGTLSQEEIETRFFNLFKSPTLFLKIESKINDLFDINGQWIGESRKKQEVPALIWVLREKGYFVQNSFKYVVQTFCLKYGIKMSARTISTQGRSFTDACESFERIFPDIKIP